MSAPPYMQLYVADYLGDTRHLTTEQHGAYLLLLMAMWRAGGRLPNEAAKLARIVGLTPAKWARLEGDVMAFFQADGAALKHSRIEKELQKYSQTVEKRRQSGSRGGMAKSLNYKGSDIASAKHLLGKNPSICGHISEPEPEEVTLVTSISAQSAETKTGKRGTRLPENWEPSAIDQEAARKEGLSDDDIGRAAREFRNYWCAKAGRDATKVSWPLTWANRVAELGQRKREREGRAMATQPRFSGASNSRNVSFADLFVQDYGQDTS